MAMMIGSSDSSSRSNCLKGNYLNCKWNRLMHNTDVIYQIKTKSESESEDEDENQNQNKKKNYLSRRMKTNKKKKNR